MESLASERDKGPLPQNLSSLGLRPHDLLRPAPQIRELIRKYIPTEEVGANEITSEGLAATVITAASHIHEFFVGEVIPDQGQHRDLNPVFELEVNLVEQMHEIMERISRYRKQPGRNDYLKALEDYRLWGIKMCHLRRKGKPWEEVIPANFTDFLRIVDFPELDAVRSLKEGGHLQVALLQNGLDIRNEELVPERLWGQPSGERIYLGFVRADHKIAVHVDRDHAQGYYPKWWKRLLQGNPSGMVPAASKLPTVRWGYHDSLESRASINWPWLYYWDRSVVDVDVRVYLTYEMFSGGLPIALEDLLRVVPPWDTITPRQRAMNYNLSRSRGSDLGAVSIGSEEHSRPAPMGSPMYSVLDRQAANGSSGSLPLEFRRQRRPIVWPVAKPKMGDLVCFLGDNTFRAVIQQANNLVSNPEIMRGEPLSVSVTLARGGRVLPDPALLEPKEDIIRWSSMFTTLTSLEITKLASRDFQKKVAERRHIASRRTVSKNVPVGH